MESNILNLNKIREAFKKAIRKVYEDAAVSGELLPVADKDGKVIYIDPKTVLNK